MGTNCHHKNALAMPLPPPHILAWRKGCDHDAALWLLLQGLMRRFGGLRAAFSLSFFFYIQLSWLLQLYTPPPPPPTSILEILSSQCNDLNLLFYTCAWSKHVRLRRRPITNQIFLPHLFQFFPGSELSEQTHLATWNDFQQDSLWVKTLKTEGNIKHKKTLEMHGQYTPLEMLTTCSLFLHLNINVSKGWGRKWRRFFFATRGNH